MQKIHNPSTNDAYVPIALNYSSIAFCIQNYKTQDKKQMLQVVYTFCKYTGYVYADDMPR